MNAFFLFKFVRVQRPGKGGRDKVVDRLIWSAAALRVLRLVGDSAERRPKDQTLVGQITGRLIEPHLLERVRQAERRVEMLKNALARTVEALAS